MIHNTSITNPTCSLLELADQFRHWRAERTSRTTPIELRRQALALLEQHSRAEVTSALGVNSKALRQWAAAEKEPSSVKQRKTKTNANQSENAGFVELPVANLPHIPTLESAQPAMSSLPSSHTPVSDLVVDLPDGTRIVARGVACADQLLAHLLARSATQGASS